MIHFYVGKPRNGKSLKAMFAIWDALTTTDRYIITNMVIFVDILQALLIKRGFGHINVRARLRMLDDKETKDFWLHREHGALPIPSDYADKVGDDVDYSPIFNNPLYYVGGQVGDDNAPHPLKGTLYIIDEVHTHWRARGWQGTPRHVEFYNSQHGKLNDMVIFITQNTKLVDQNFIRLAQDFTYCRNHRLEKHGKFRGDNKLTASTYPGPVSNSNEVTLNVEEYKLDLEMAQCYDTSAGVGMPGGGVADGGFRSKGVPLKMVWVGLAVVLLVVFCVFRWVIPKMTRKFIAPALGGPSAVSSALGVSSSPSLPVSSEMVKKPSYEVPPIDTTPANPLYCTGWVVKGGRYLVTLSNGDTIRESESRDGRPIITAINSTRIVLRDGTIYRVRGRPIPPPQVDIAQSVVEPDAVPRGTKTE